MKLNWTDPAPPNGDCCYDHVYADSPFGRLRITWKSWKERTSYDVDEAPWDNTYASDWGYDSLQDAKDYTEKEFARRIEECLKLYKND